MYKRVSSQEDLDLFHKIKKVSWDQKGFEMEYVKEDSDLFLFYAEDGTPGGTYEFTPYTKFTSQFMEDLFADVVTKDMHVVEMDSFSVLPQYRGKLGREIICFVFAYAKKHGYTHSIGISDPTLFHSLNNTYHMNAQQVKDKLWYKGDYVIPTLIHLKEIYENIEEYSWFIKPIEMKKNEVGAH